ncbi:MAG: biotin--[acetyl-CoA-carboxylase] ligase [Candidatus Omnitrophica bacterium]|nr:biotin--[acetyl-CoA-carboxylase] ligase [Candidatus Omnitrophota bacterium]
MTMNIDDKILHIFKKYGAAYVSGEDISRDIGVSRTSIWKHIESLRSLGYDIEASPHLGYRLTGRPDRLIPEELKNNLKTKFLGKNILSYASLDSTNDTAYKLAENGAKEGTVIVAERQKKGKGRQGRHWVSPKGGIYFSCIIRPDIEPKEVAKITLASALAVCTSIREIARIPALIKWPNDIIIGGKKVCGILTEMKAEQDKVDFLVVGIGINADNPISLLPKGSTTLSEESDADVSKVELAKKVLEKLEHYILLFKKEGFKPIRDEWRDLSETLGRHVRVHSHEGKIEGQAIDVDNDGALVVRLDSGFHKRILSGDVVIAH